MAHNKESPDCNFSLGQLAWAQIRKFPYWPCVITLDAKELSYTKMKNFGRVKSVVVHVQYFGDNCRHEWVSQHSMIPFSGLADFRKFAENSNCKVRPKSRKYLDPYNPSSVHRSKWETAIEEATKVLNLTNDERAKRFNLEETCTTDNLKIILDTAMRGRLISRERTDDLAWPNMKSRKREEEITFGKGNPVSVESEKTNTETLSKSLLIHNAHKRSPYNLFYNVKHERTCWKCAKTGDLTRCDGQCTLYFHSACMKDHEMPPKPIRRPGFSMRDALIYALLLERKSDAINDDDQIKNVTIVEKQYSKCKDCRCGTAPACFICHDRENDKLICSVTDCERKYHAECLKAWPQSHIQEERFICPRHVCHTCNSINPQEDISTFSNDKLVHCSKCPAAYHTASSCVPAGSELLTDSMEIVCPRHYDVAGPLVKSAWCYLCKRDGNLVRCDKCPISFHPECIEGMKGVERVDRPLICKYCETGRMPVYGEVVWVKLGQFRWWPARICFLHYEIPKRVYTTPHRPGDYCVTFLGTINYQWVDRSQVFLYQKCDASGEVSSKLCETNADGSYALSLKEAIEIHQHFEKERVAINEIIENNRRRENNEDLPGDPFVEEEENEEILFVPTILDYEKVVNEHHGDPSEDQSEQEMIESSVDESELHFEEL